MNVQRLHCETSEARILTTGLDFSKYSVGNSFAVHVCLCSVCVCVCVCVCACACVCVCVCALKSMQINVLTRLGTHGTSTYSLPILDTTHPSMARHEAELTTVQFVLQPLAVHNAIAPPRRTHTHLGVGGTVELPAVLQGCLVCEARIVCTKSVYMYVLVTLRYEYVIQFINTQWHVSSMHTKS